MYSLLTRPLTFICEDHNTKSDRDHDDDGDHHHNDCDDHHEDGDVLEELSQQKDIFATGLFVMLIN